MNPNKNPQQKPSQNGSPNANNPQVVPDKQTDNPQLDDDQDEVTEQTKAP